VIPGGPFVLAVVAQLLGPTGGASAWGTSGAGGIRGVTVGPIENGYHTGVGYGSAAFDRALVEIAAMGGTWVSLTPFGRVHDLAGTGVDLTFESPFEKNRGDVVRAIEMAHARGLRVMLVPPLWVESGEWRGDIDPKTDAGWMRWAKSYERFVTTWAQVAEETNAELFSVGVELRSWVTGGHVQSFRRIIREVRRVYRGLVTYSANWDDVEHTLILGDLDLIGVNAFYPLADSPQMTPAQRVLNGQRVRERVHGLAELWRKPVVFTEAGYTARTGTSIHPWEWPDALSGVKPDEAAQAEAYRNLLAPFLDEPDFAGFFVWRLYADPDDTSQEPEWGFSPRGRRAEIVMRDAFAAPWACDPWWTRDGRWPEGARVPGVY
jgi:hypothetical protein